MKRSTKLVIWLTIVIAITSIATAKTVVDTYYIQHFPKTEPWEILAVWTFFAIPVFIFGAVPAVIVNHYYEYRKSKRSSLEKEQWETWKEEG